MHGCEYKGYGLDLYLKTEDGSEVVVGGCRDMAVVSRPDRADIGEAGWSGAWGASTKRELREVGVLQDLDQREWKYKRLCLESVE